MNRCSMDPEYFASPSTLRQFALETAAKLSQAGLSEAGNIMETAANFAATTGSEWLGELGLAANTVAKRFKVPEPLGARISRIARVSASRHPYG